MLSQARDLAASHGYTVLQAVQEWHNLRSESFHVKNVIHIIVLTFATPFSPFGRHNDEKFTTDAESICKRRASVYRPRSRPCAVGAANEWCALKNHVILELFKSPWKADNDQNTRKICRYIDLVESKR